MILGDNGVSDNNILLAGTTGGASVNQTEQSNSATASTDGYTDGPEGNSIRQLGTDSLFNPFIYLDIRNLQLVPVQLMLVIMTSVNIKINIMM